MNIMYCIFVQFAGILRGGDMDQDVLVVYPTPVHGLFSVGPPFTDMKRLKGRLKGGEKRVAVE
jgi:hypothetical protein